METRSLDEKIILEAKLKAEEILKETTKTVEELKANGLSAIRSHYKDVITEAVSQREVKINMLDKQLNNEVNAYKRQAKQEVIEKIFESIYLKVKAFEKGELLNWVLKLIDNKEVTGNENILVSNKDYEKYLNALSSKKNSENLDLLNQKNKIFNFKLKAEDLNIESGFVLEGKTFDLIFDNKEIISNHKKNLEQKVYKELFKNE